MEEINMHFLFNGSWSFVFSYRRRQINFQLLQFSSPALSWYSEIIGFILAEIKKIALRNTFTYSTLVDNDSRDKFQKKKNPTFQIYLGLRYHTSHIHCIAYSTKGRNLHFTFIEYEKSNIIPVLESKDKKSKIIL